MKSTTISIRRNLAIVLLAALLPMGVFTGILFYGLWQTQQESRIKEQLNRVRAMASLVQSDLDSSMRRIELLALNPLLSAATMAAYHAHLVNVLAANKNWSNLVVVSRESQIVNADIQYGAPLPAARNLPHHLAAFASLQPQVSDLFTSNRLNAQVIGVAVPVVRNGKADYLLLANLRQEHVADALLPSIPPGGVATVVDRNYRILARTVNGPEYFGKSPSDALLELMRSAREGVARTTTREGVRVFTAWTALDNGWSIATGMPSAEADAALLRYLVLLVLAWLAALLTGFALARFLWRRIELSIATTVGVARRLAVGEAASFPDSTVTELAVLAESVWHLFTQERAARSEAEKANRAKDEFLAMLGHELRNPLSAISNAVHILEAGTVTNEAREFAQKVVARQSGILRRLVNDLLDIGRVLTGKIALERRPVDLANSVTHAVQTLASTGKTLHHSVKIEAAPVWVDGDDARIEQILTNLLINAVNHTLPGGHIGISVRRDGSDAVLDVKDDGIGIPAESLGRIFELFYQERQEKNRPRSGLGIGLTLVQRLMQLHGGTVTAHSAGRDQGTTFTLRFPALDEAGMAAFPPGETQRGAAGRILLVEDNADARESLRMALALEGHQVKAVNDGPAGIAMLSGFRPHVMIVDIGLPGMDGYAVARAVKQQFDRAPYLVALTGYGLPEDERNALAAGFDAHITKPADMAYLNELIASLLEDDTVRLLSTG